ncbi:MAG: NAD(+) synthase [Planctomycetales bacterium]|nr:NAD(+) synthase [Planctomycetales bacterium]
MKLIKVAAAVLNQTPLDWAGNTDRIRQAISMAHGEGVSILCLPELCITGYGCEDAFHSPGVHATAFQILTELAESTCDMIVSFGLPIMHAGGVFNTACLVTNGQILGFVGKQFLAGDGIHYEPRWFKRWPADTTATLHMGGQDYPIGDLLFRCGDVRIGFEICEDAWVGERPGADLAARGADIILNPSASHFAFGKHQIRKRFVLEGSRAFQVSYVYANLLGNESGRAIFDGDAMIASNGQILAAGERLSFADVDVTAALIDVDATRMQRARTASFDPDVQTDPDYVVNCDFSFPNPEPMHAEVIRQDWEDVQEPKAEEFTRAVALGLFDYVRKSRSSGVVVSLSGGADSAAVASLSYLMLRLAEQDIGLDGIRNKLSYLSDSDKLLSVEAWARRMITTVYQATRNSTNTTKNAAAAVAQGIGAHHLVFDVDAIVEQYKMTVAGGLGRELTWQQDDIALQNIQARVRAPSVWMLANVFGSLLLSTSNRSEAAVGYATMDGDTSGGLAPIAGIDKAYLRTWLVWLETTGPVGIGPIPELAAVNQQQPTAELRPQSEGQTDEGDLMPYVILDQIERLAIRDKLMPLEVLRQMRSKHADIDLSQMATWVDRFFRLWCRNQWKRERYAPSFHLDDENLDPKTWCRFPILSGGFEMELEQMRAYVEAKVRGNRSPS